MAVLAGLLVAVRRGRRAGGLLVGFAALDLVAFHVVVVPVGVPPTLLEALRRPVESAAAAVRALPPRLPGLPVPDRVLLLPPPAGSNWASLAGAPLVQGYNLLVRRELAAQLGQRTEAALESIGLVDDPSLADDASHVLDLLRVRLVLRDPDAVNPLGDRIAAAAATSAGRWRRLEDVSSGTQRYEAYENRRALPLAWLVHEAVAMPHDEIAPALRGVSGSTRDAPEPTRVAIVESGRDPGLSLEEHPAGASLDSPAVEVVAAGEDHLAFRVATPRRALLVTSEVAAPGWEALVDDTPVDVLRVNGLSRGVVVPPGAHRIDFAYRPASAPAGAAISAVSLVLLLAILLVSYWRAGRSG